ncbi:dimethylallyl [Perilla frutescens var. frutescens]|nr:dimethylallyl [Perilla frutescens var. frutescens]
MAREECSYKRTTLVVCSVNVVVALYVLHSLYASVYMYSFTDTYAIFKYSANQISKMEESNQIRKAAEPTELIQLVSKLNKNFVSERVEELPQHLKQKLIYEIVDRLRSLDAAANGTDQQDAVESWRKQKLKEAKKLIRGKKLNTTILPEEAGALSRALGSDWSELSEEIGLWIPVGIVNKEHDDKPLSEEEFDEEILPGRKLPPECHAELHTDYDGAAVRWGLTHHKDSAYECCMSCLDQARRAKPGEKKCNIWVYCPSEMGCYSPDIYEHKDGECWLKYSETPKLNFKDRYPESYRDAHTNAPVVVPWVSGVVGI